MTNIHSNTARFAVLFTLLTAGSVRAGQITGFTAYPGINSVAATTIAAPVNPNNDNVASGNPNDAWITQKDYKSISPVDLVFTVGLSGGVTEYAFREGVQNNTFLPWTGYHLELGFGHDSSFVKSTPGDGLDFDDPSYDSTIDFNPFFPLSSATTEDDIVAGGGVQPYLTFAPNYRFSVDVPDTFTSFTIRQSPIGGGVAPEPGSLVFIAIALSVGTFFRKRNAA